MERQLVSSGSPWESGVGYSRAVRVGDLVFVSGTTGTDETGAPVGDTEQQARHAFAKIARALHEAGATLADVVRTRIFVTNITEWEPIAQVHLELFGDVRPAATMVEVSRLIGEGITIEIEADAVIG